VFRQRGTIFSGPRARTVALFAVVPCQLVLDQCGILKVAGAMALNHCLDGLFREIRRFGRHAGEVELFGGAALSQ